MAAKRSWFLSSSIRELLNARTIRPKTAATAPTATSPPPKVVFVFSLSAASASEPAPERDATTIAPIPNSKTAEPTAAKDQPR